MGIARLSGKANIQITEETRGDEYIKARFDKCRTGMENGSQRYKGTETDGRGNRKLKSRN